ncbi:MAG: glycine oxidase ThiO [Pseudomonadota bacterium]|nr:glycine oxidase ThiO [Pseudomonadota bacterium]
MADVLIVGGGIIGLLVAKELLEQGAKVTLLEQGQPGQEASWAGGGIVSPLYPWTYSEPVTALASWAQAAYPQLVAELNAATGLDPELNLCGLLMLEPPNQAEMEAWARARGKNLGLWAPEQIQQREPDLATTFSGGVWWPHIGNVRNPRLLQSLLLHLQRQPEFELHCQEQVEEFTAQPSGAVSVLTLSGNRFSAAQVAVCAGAWAGRLLQPLAASIQVQPVRGQMLVYAPRRKLLNSIVLHNGRYLIPRLDGRIVAGSTLEHTEFHKASTREARQELVAMATGLVPALAKEAVEAQWAGLRPGSPHGIPFIGRVPGWDNLFVNAGHYRNGLVLAPASARLMRDLLLGQEPIVDPVPYDPLTPRPSADMF